MRISLPSGGSWGNSAFLTVAPITHTVLQLRTSKSVNIAPSAMSSQSRMSR